MRRKDIHRIVLVWGAAFFCVFIVVNAVIAQSPPDGGGPSGAAEEEEGPTGQEDPTRPWRIFEDCIEAGEPYWYCDRLPRRTPTPTPTPTANATATAAAVATANASATAAAVATANATATAAAVATANASATAAAVATANASATAAAVATANAAATAAAVATANAAATAAASATAAAVATANAAATAAASATAAAVATANASATAAAVATANAAATAVAATTLPSPTGLRVEKSTQNSVSLRWNAVSNASKYKLERSNNGSTWNSVDNREITHPTTSKKATGLDRCTTYYFRVRTAGDGSTYSTNFGSPSSSVSGTTTGCPTPIPTPTNVPPEFRATSYSFSVAENLGSGTAVGTVSATDQNARDKLKYSLRGRVSVKDAFDIDVNSGQLKTKEALNYETQSSYSFRAAVSDGNGGTDTVPVTVTVTDVNEPPIVRNAIPAQTLTVGGSALTINLSDKFHDPDAGDTLTYTVSTSPQGVVTATLSGSNRSTLTIRPSAVRPPTVGSTEVTVTAYDSDRQSANRNRLSTEQKFTATVVSHTSTVAFENSSYTVGEGESVDIKVTLTSTSASATGSTLTIPITVTDGTATKADGDYTVNGLTNGSLSFTAGQTEKTFAVTATQDADTSEENMTLGIGASLPGGVLADSTKNVATVTIQPKLSPPTDLDVIPLPSTRNGQNLQRKAKLTWTTVTDATEYVVQGKAPSGSWFVVKRGVLSPEHEIVLDDILVANLHYDYRVIATSSGFSDSEPSDTVRIVDSPILSINGDSSSPVLVQGKAVVKWTPASDVDSSGYTLRFRELVEDQSGVSHTDPNWEIDGTSLPSFDRDPQTHPTFHRKIVSGIQGVAPHHVYGLNLDSIYAVQLNYTTTGGIHVFSGRDAYVLPTRAVPSMGTRAASIYVDHRGATKPFRYRICLETFPNEQFSPTDTRNKREAWEQIIQHAFEQWEIATDGLIEMTYVTPAPPDTGCADYSSIVQAVANEVSTSSTATPISTIRAKVATVVAGLNTTGIIDRIEDDDNIRNEVIMFDDVQGNLRTIIDAGSGGYTIFLTPTPAISLTPAPAVFPELADALGYTWCSWHTGTEGCTQFSTDDHGRKTSDVFIRRGAFEPGGVIPIIPTPTPGGSPTPTPSPVPTDPLEIPGTLTPVRLNACPATHQSSRVYYVLVHEAGHALGLGVVPGQISNPTSNDFHSNLHDSVVYKTGLEWCSPPPIDVMTIYAIYQTTN